MNDVINSVSDWLESLPGYVDLSNDQKKLLICLCSVQVVSLTTKYFLDRKDEFVEVFKNL